MRVMSSVKRVVWMDMWADIGLLLTLTRLRRRVGPVQRASSRVARTGSNLSRPDGAGQHGVTRDRGHLFPSDGDK